MKFNHLVSNLASRSKVISVRGPTKMIYFISKRGFLKLNFLDRRISRTLTTIRIDFQLTFLSYPLMTYDLEPSEANEELTVCLLQTAKYICCTFFGKRLSSSSFRCKEIFKAEGLIPSRLKNTLAPSSGP